MIRSLLVPLDGSPFSEHALPLALALARRAGADLVVMTTHARGPLGRLWLGSVADRLVRELPVPLLLVHPRDTAVDLAQEPALKHLLLPLDGTALAEQIVEPATTLGRLTDAEYTLLRVTQPVLPLHYHLEGGSFGEMAESAIHQIDTLQGQVRKEAVAYLEGVAGRLRQQGLRERTRVVEESQPAAAILHEAASLGADLIALETHGRHGLSRLLLGSVADKVIRGAAVPVLVHRPAYP